MRKMTLTAIVFSVVLSGCATIVGEPNQLLPITSSPEGATVTITDEKGAQVFKGTTPTSVTLAKSDGSYWGGKDYKAVIQKEGYSSYELEIKTSPNGWYIGGNLIFGGLIGYFIVDPLNGDMYSLSVDEINAALNLEELSDNSDDQLSIVLLDDVPEELHSKLVKLN